MRVDLLAIAAVGMGVGALVYRKVQRGLEKVKETARTTGYADGYRAGFEAPENRRTWDIVGMDGAPRLEFAVRGNDPTDTAKFLLAEKLMQRLAPVPPEYLPLKHEGLQTEFLAQNPQPPIVGERE